ncbi:hypothetical protein SELMODRAFT_120998 [Selaginella moellendorffii]|uniref:Iron export ABC transporter permease subunit FetB n=2 Tax=Selaginella moellendorffii TaxID=88036 RepID=D8SN84_SELML|nr:hypothetical protein SELMODRAFT_182039 [Selaginella moellendorffii]EFJ14025.1 hypothetical protein SELMODRAFT_120998 [Selaginella moellendorffii]
MILEVLARNAFEEFAAGMLKPVAALAIVGMAIALSLVQRLQLEQEMVTSIARAFVQLALIGFILQFIFEQKNAVWIFVAYTFMVIVAGYTAGRRARHVPRSPYIAGISIFIGTGVTLALLLLLRVFPLTPRYMIPVSGMMVGNSMTVTGVAMKNLRDNLKMQMNQVETALALGATPSQAIKRPMKRTLILALSPVLDNTKTVGLISLPGAMTGLIMGGASPLEAVRLQMVVMNMLVGAATFSSLVAAYLSWQYFFTKTMQVETKVFLDE